MAKKKLAPRNELLTLRPERDGVTSLHVASDPAGAVENYNVVVKVQVNHPGGLLDAVEMLMMGTKDRCYREAQRAGFRVLSVRYSTATDRATITTAFEI